ncbi:HAD family phosphatase [bacterium]|nr:HAD family phosphatase [bacterium]
MIHKYKAILFDMDGVIVDTMPYHFSAWQEIFESMGVHLDKREVYKREGEQGIVSISEILENHGKYLSVPELKKLLRDKEMIFKKIASPDLFPGVEDLILGLKENGHLLGLVTGTSRDEAEHLLPASLASNFDIIVTGDDVERGKPAPDPYLKAMEGLNVKPDDTLVIENAPYGIKSAKDAGTFCIALTTSLPREYIKDADMVFDSLEGVRWLILSGNP